MNRIRCCLALAVSLMPWPLHAQEREQGGAEFARAYAFDDRKPRTLLEATIDRLLPSMVKVHGASGLSTIQSYASGVIVSKQGHILTADLVLIQKDKTRVVLHDGSIHQASLYPSDRKHGVRLLKIDPGDRDLVPVTLTRNSVFRNGTMVMSLGNCFRLAEFSEKISATFGVLTARARTGLRYRMSDVDYDGELLITDAPNNPGHYGGGLFTLRGKWIGVNARILESTETNTQISAAIPVWDLAEYVERHAFGKLPTDVAGEGGEQRPVYHGIKLFDHGRRSSPPAYIEKTERGSPARATGLKPDDLIVRIDDWPVRSCNDFRKTLARYRPGNVIQITYKRGSKVARAEMTLGEVKK